jgi:beta-1,4-mannosyl-glycoprotein beta-1,4-N-acetylglucosaminyltransferase
MLFKGIYDALPEDLIMYSDSDEIPNPHILKNYNLEKKYGIFMMDSYVYKINIHNKYETPWEGTRISKKKNMKNFTFLRKKIKKNNLSKSFWKFYIEKNITVIQNGGWHFNNLYSPGIISKKLKTFAHREYSSQEFSSVEVIKKKISSYKDLFNRNHTYEKVSINQNFPKFILNNLELFKNFID